MQRVEKNQIEIKHAKVVRIRKMADLEKCSTPVKTPMLSSSFEASTITGSPIKMSVSSSTGLDITVSEPTSPPNKPTVRRALDLESLPVKRRQSLNPDAFSRRRSNLVRASGTSRDHKSLSKWLDKREYECDQCGIRFFHASAVLAHKLTHTDTPPRSGSVKRIAKRARNNSSDKSENQSLTLDESTVFGSLTSLRMPKKAKLMAKIRRISFFKPTIKNLKSSL